MKPYHIAIAYDFDGTLTAGNMQEHSFIPKLGIDNKEFWKEANTLAQKNNMNGILAYMFLMLKKARQMDQRITREAFIDHGKGIKLFPGVEDYFERINKYAAAKNIKIEHYIISSGLDDILKGTSIYDKFEMVYASSYMYDVNDVAEWPALAIDYTNKTQFLFRINKGIKNVWDDRKINQYMSSEERPVPFERMIYIGDGETDIPAMKMLNYQGGKSIAVFNTNGSDEEVVKSKENAEKLIKYGRASYIAAADYSENSDLDKLIKLCIDSIITETELLNYKKWK